MNRLFSLNLATCTLALFLVACAEVSEYVVGEETIKPTELTQIKQTLPVKLAWSTQLNTVKGRDEGRIDPIEIDGLVYVAEPEGRVVAHDANNGRLVWETLLDKSLSAGIGKANGLLLLGTDNGEVLALDKDKGEQKWLHKATSEVLVPPLMKDNIVIVYSGDGVITAINSETGERLWANRNSVPSLSLRGSSVPFISGEKLIVGLANGRLIALDIRNGKKMWETTVAVAKGRSELQRIVDLDSAVRIRDGVIYIASYQGRLAAVNENNGRIIWVRELSSYQAIEVGESELYLTDNASQVWAVDRKSGATLWRQDKLKGRFLTAPVIQSDYLVIGDYRGFVHWLNREDGDIVARQNMETANTAAEVEGSVSVIEFEVGGDFEYKEVAGIIATPLVVGNMLYIADKGGVLAAYRIGNGV